MLLHSFPKIKHTYRKMHRTVSVQFHEFSQNKHTCITILRIKKWDITGTSEIFSDLSILPSSPKAN